MFILTLQAKYPQKAVRACSISHYSNYQFINDPPVKISNNINKLVSNRVFIFDALRRYSVINEEKIMMDD
jgi:hypothetical protein